MKKNKGNTITDWLDKNLLSLERQAAKERAIKWVKDNIRQHDEDNNYLKKELEKYKNIKTEIIGKLNLGEDIDSASQGAFIGGADFEKYFEQNLKNKQEKVQEQIEQYIESRIEESKKESRELQGLILKFRLWLSQRESTEKLMFGEPKYTRKIIKEFDEHFNITTQRHGEL